MSLRLFLTCWLALASCAPAATTYPDEAPPRAAVRERPSFEARVERVSAPTPWSRTCVHALIGALEEARGLSRNGTAYDHLEPEWRDVTDGSEEISIFEQFKSVILSVTITHRPGVPDASVPGQPWRAVPADGYLPDGSRAWHRETPWGTANLFFRYRFEEEDLIPLLRPAVDHCLAE